MKNLLFVLLLITSNLHSQKSIPDKLIGKWQLFKEIENNIDNSSECRRKTTLEYLPNGEAIINDYVEESEIDDTCSFQTKKGSWKNIGNSKYLFGKSKQIIKVNFEKDSFYILSKFYKTTTKYIYKKITL